MCNLLGDESPIVLNHDVSVQNGLGDVAEHASDEPVDLVEVEEPLADAEEDADLESNLEHSEHRGESGQYAVPPSFGHREDDFDHVHHVEEHDEEGEELHAADDWYAEAAGVVLELRLVLVFKRSLEFVFDVASLKSLAVVLDGLINKVSSDQSSKDTQDNNSFGVVLDNCELEVFGGIFFKQGIVIRTVVHDSVRLLVDPHDVLSSRLVCDPSGQSSLDDVGDHSPNENSLPVMVDEPNDEADGNQEVKCQLQGGRKGDLIA